EKQGQQNAGNAEDHVEEVLPNPVLDVSAEFNANPTQDEQPENDRQRKVEPAEARRIESRKCKIKRAASSDQPDLVAIPHRPDGTQHPASFVVRLGSNQINRARAKIKSVEHDIGRDHRRDNPEPKARHITSLSYLASV